MNEQEVRAIVREAIERHLGRPDGATGVAPSRQAEAERRVAAGRDRPNHPSHILLTVPPGSEIDDGMCVIEPAVRCNHCGFCQSYGH